MFGVPYFFYLICDLKECPLKGTVSRNLNMVVQKSILIHKNKMWISTKTTTELTKSSSVMTSFGIRLVNVYPKSLNIGKHLQVHIICIILSKQNYFYFWESESSLIKKPYLH
jgi:hypothetical protein